MLENCKQFGDYVKKDEMKKRDQSEEDEKTGQKNWNKIFGSKGKRWRNPEGKNIKHNRKRI